MVIADEVQPGFGRLGTGMWGFDRHGLRPDLVTMGKPMANGLPVAAVAARADLIDEFGNAENYFNTFGGNPVSMAAALAVLDIVQQDDIISHVAEVGTHLASGLTEIDAPIIGGVRAIGLFVGIDIVDDGGKTDPKGAAKIINALRDQGFLISSCGYAGATLKIRPPLVLTFQQADMFIEAFAHIASLYTRAPRHD